MSKSQFPIKLQAQNSKILVIWIRELKNKLFNKYNSNVKIHTFACT